MIVKKSRERGKGGEGPGLEGGWTGAGERGGVSKLQSAPPTLTIESPSSALRTWECF